jgi:hypothetical protein
VFIINNISLKNKSILHNKNQVFTFDGSFVVIAVDEINYVMIKIVVDKEDDMDI